MSYRIYVCVCVCVFLLRILHRLADDPDRSFDVRQFLEAVAQAHLAAPDGHQVASRMHAVLARNVYDSRFELARRGKSLQRRLDKLALALGFRVLVGAVEVHVAVYPQGDPMPLLGRELHLVVILV